jgi:hypothetical protein
MSQVRISISNLAVLLFFVIILSPAKYICVIVDLHWDIRRQLPGPFSFITQSSYYFTLLLKQVKKRCSVIKESKEAIQRCCSFSFEDKKRWPTLKQNRIFRSSSPFLLPYLYCSLWGLKKHALKVTQVFDEFTSSLKLVEAIGKRNGGVVRFSWTTDKHWLQLE